MTEENAIDLVKKLRFEFIKEMGWIPTFMSPEREQAVARYVQATLNLL